MSEYRVSPTERKKEGEKLIFDGVWFSIILCSRPFLVTLKSLESVHRQIYFLFCNVLHIWTIRDIPTYRVYQLYDKWA